MITASQPNASFYREFLMRRGDFDPKEFGVNTPKTEFVDQLVDAFNTFVRGQLSLDELLLRPSAALDFCQTVKRSTGWYDVPDDIILRTIMNARKH